MSDLVRYAFWPFLPGIREAVAEVAPSPKDLLTSTLWAQARNRGAERVEIALTDAPIETGNVSSESRALTELMGQAVARMLLVCMGDRILAQRYASREAARVRRLLRSEPRAETILELAIEAGLPIEESFGEDHGPSKQVILARMTVPTYLRLQPQRDECKLLLQPVTKGWVYLSRARLEQFLESFYQDKLQSELLAEIQKGAPQDLKEALEPLLLKLEPKFEESRKHWSTGDFGAVAPSAFPPCIDQLFEDMKVGAMIPHHGRFAFASFLANIGMNGDQILDYMTQLPNFNRNKSEYQIRHIAGEMGVEGYTPPGCSSMQANGICPLARRDEICATIKHPLSYYRRKKKRMAPEIEDLTSKSDPKDAKEGST